jgi:hypothetical protein
MTTARRRSSPLEFHDAKHIARVSSAKSGDGPHPRTCTLVRTRAPFIRPSPPPAFNSQVTGASPPLNGVPYVRYPPPPEARERVPADPIPPPPPYPPPLRPPGRDSSEIRLRLN